MRKTPVLIMAWLLTKIDHAYGMCCSASWQTTLPYLKSKVCKWHNSQNLLEENYLSLPIAVWQPDNASSGRVNVLSLQFLVLSYLYRLVEFIHTAFYLQSHYWNVIDIMPFLFLHFSLSDHFTNGLNGTYKVSKGFGLYWILSVLWNINEIYCYPDSVNGYRIKIWYRRCHICYMYKHPWCEPTVLLSSFIHLSKRWHFMKP